jgi:hypothetical protein
MSDDTIRLTRVIVRVTKIDAINVTLTWDGRSVTVPIDSIALTLQPLLLRTHLRFYAHAAGDELFLHHLAPAPTAHLTTVGRRAGPR